MRTRDLPANFYDDATDSDRHLKAWLVFIQLGFAPEQSLTDPKLFLREMKKFYLKKALCWHPDHICSTEKESVKNQIQEMFKHLALAYKHLEYHLNDPNDAWSIVDAWNRQQEVRNYCIFNRPHVWDRRNEWTHSETETSEA